MSRPGWPCEVFCCMRAADVGQLRKPMCILHVALCAGKMQRQGDVAELRSSVKEGSAGLLSSLDCRPAGGARRAGAGGVPARAAHHAAAQRRAAAAPGHPRHAPRRRARCAPRLRSPCASCTAPFTLPAALCTPHVDSGMRLPVHAGPRRVSGRADRIPMQAQGMLRGRSAWLQNG